MNEETRHQEKIREQYASGTGAEVTCVDLC
jgi:hypothetical protein